MPITDAQMATLNLLAQGNTVPVIATRLGLSRTTVHHHLRAVETKLGVENRTELLLFIAKAGDPDGERWSRKVAVLEREAQE